LAELGGMNLLAGTAADGALDIGGGMLVRGIADPDEPLVAGSPGLASISPAAVSIHLTTPEGSPRNVWPAVVSTVEARGELARVRLTLGDQTLVAELTSQSVAALELGPGATVWAAVKAVQVRLYGR
jgi:molybdate transport system ATP-binding protein